MSAPPSPDPSTSQPPPRLRPWKWWPVVGAVVGGAAGLGYYLLWGCDSG